MITMEDYTNHIASGDITNYRPNNLLSRVLYTWMW